jgi:hypothetical protein
MTLIPPRKRKLLWMLICDEFYLIRNRMVMSQIKYFLVVLPFRSVAIKRRMRSSGSEVHPDPILVTATIWGPEDRISRPPRATRRTVHLPHGHTTHSLWLPATEED